LHKAQKIVIGIGDSELAIATVDTLFITLFIIDK